MNQSAAHPFLESLLAGLLQYGSWVASVAIGLGLVLSLFGLAAPSYGIHILTAGVALFILLPVLRVLVMFLVFLSERDYKFTLIAGLVLVILVAGVIVGLRTSRIAG